MRSGRAKAYAFGMGIFLALLQTGYFFHLATFVTAAYPGYLTLTVGWLGGAALGLRLHHRRPNACGADFRTTFFWLAGSLLAFLFSYALCRMAPYRLETLPVHALFVLLSGLQAGVFFGAARSLFKRAAPLFFWENNGFVAGWIIGFLGFVIMGSSFSLYAPALAAPVVLLLFVAPQNERQGTSS